MTGVLLACWIFMGMTGLSILALLFSRKLIYAAFLLFAVLLGVACMYVFLGAEFLAIAQLLIYVGGILVLIMFGIMLTQREGSSEAMSKIANIFPSLGLAAVALLALLYLWNGFRQQLPSWMQASAGKAELQNIEQIGTLTLSTYLLPFEFMSILLLLALLGAAVLARQASQKNEHE